MHKVVLDSTVLVSAFLAKTGVSAELLHKAKDGVFQKICSCQTSHLIPSFSTPSTNIRLHGTKGTEQQRKINSDPASEYLQLKEAESGK